MKILEILNKKIMIICKTSLTILTEVTQVQSYTWSVKFPHFQLLLNIFRSLRQWNAEYVLKYPQEGLLLLSLRGFLISVRYVWRCQRICRFWQIWGWMWMRFTWIQTKLANSCCCSTYKISQLHVRVEQDWDWDLVGISIKPWDQFIESWVSLSIVETKIQKSQNQWQSLKPDTKGLGFIFL